MKMGKSKHHKIVIALIASVISPSVMSETSFFIGGGYALPVFAYRLKSTKIIGDEGTPGTGISAEKPIIVTTATKHSGLKIFGGAIVDGIHRVGLSYQLLSEEAMLRTGEDETQGKGNVFAVNYDYLFSSGWYAGVNMGILTLRYTDLDKYSPPFENFNNIVTGATATSSSTKTSGLGLRGGYMFTLNEQSIIAVLFSTHQFTVPNISGAQKYQTKGVWFKSEFSTFSKYSVKPSTMLLLSLEYTYTFKYKHKFLNCTANTHHSCY